MADERTGPAILEGTAGNRYNRMEWAGAFGGTWAHSFRS